jgi:hypothetical protein
MTDLRGGHNADEEVSENEPHLNHLNLLLSLNRPAIPLRGHSIERYVPPFCAC